jgi:hypothetical protein
VSSGRPTTRGCCGQWGRHIAVDARPGALLVFNPKANQALLISANAVSEPEGVAEAFFLRGKCAHAVQAVKDFPGECPGGLRERKVQGFHKNAASGWCPPASKFVPSQAPGNAGLAAPGSPSATQTAGNFFPIRRKIFQVRTVGSMHPGHPYSSTGHAPGSCRHRSSRGCARLHAAPLEPPTVEAAHVHNKDVVRPPCTFT